MLRAVVILFQTSVAFALHWAAGIPFLVVVAGLLEVVDNSVVDSIQ